MNPSVREIVEHAGELPAQQWPQSAPKEKPHRLSLDVSHRFREQLAELEAMLEAVSLTEAVRRSVGITRGLIAHTRTGGKVIFRNADGTEREVVLL